MTISHPHADRGFTTAEFEARTIAAQRIMETLGLGALLLTTEPEVRYFTGFDTIFWLSPTRPWFLVIPAKGKPIAVIPEIGGPSMAKTWLDDIRTWLAPQPEDDGISLLVATLKEVFPKGCVFRGDPPTDSDLMRPPVPILSAHRFRGIRPPL